jgi:hypothetical protein
MAGSHGPRNMNSRFMRARDVDPDVEEGSSDGRRQRARSSGSGSGSRRGRPPLVRPHDVSEEECRTPDSSDEEELVRQTNDKGDEAQQGGKAGGTAGLDSSAVARIYLRGPSKLPGPSLLPLRPVIRPPGEQVSNFRFYHSYII